MPRAENCKCKYTVVVNMAGYLPDNDPECYRTKRAAQAGAKWHADQYRDDGEMVVRSDTRPARWEPRYRVTGNKREGYTAVNPTSKYELPTYIAVHEVCPDDAAHYCQCDDCQ